MHRTKSLLLYIVLSVLYSMLYNAHMPHRCVRVCAVDVLCNGTAKFSPCMPHAYGFVCLAKEEEKSTRVHAM